MANDYDKLKKQLIEYYQDLLIVQYHDKPKAKAMIKAEIEETLANLLDIQVRDAFDVDTAVGVQLDIIGKWVGVDRIFKGQMFDNKSWFSLTRYNEPTTPLQGGFSRFDNFDTLEGGFLTYDFIVSTRNKINDTDFRMLIKLKIIRNNIKHSPKDIDEAMYKLFADTLYTVWNEMVYNSDAFTVVGSPTITEDGIASGFSRGNYIITSNNSIIPTESIIIKTSINANSLPSETQRLFTLSNMVLFFFAYYSNGAIACRLTGSDNLITIPKNSINWEFNKNLDIEFKVTKSKTYLTMTQGENSVTREATTNIDLSDISYEGTWIGGTPTGNYFSNGSIDLKQFSITVDGKEVFSGSKSQPMEMTFYYKNKNYGIVKLGQEKNCFPIPTGVKANFVEVK